MILHPNPNLAESPGSSQGGAIIIYSDADVIPVSDRATAVRMEEILWNAPWRQRRRLLCAMATQMEAQMEELLRNAPWRMRDREKRMILNALCDVWPQDLVDLISLDMVSRDVGQQYRAIGVQPDEFAISIDCAGLTRNGCGGTCDHVGGKGPLPKSYHGTKTLATAGAILSHKGVIKDSVRPLKNMAGFYHAPLLDIAIKYAHAGSLRSRRVRCVFEICAECAKSCKQKRKWMYTPSGCKRYHVQRLLLIPARGPVDLLA